MRSTRFPLALLTWGLVCAAAYAALTWQCRWFADDSDPLRRPIPLVLAILAMAFVGYIGAQCSAIRRPADPGAMLIIIGGALLFRAIVLPSTPILEIDYYRYLWDGAVTTQGISPFRYSPEAVLSTSKPGDDADLRALRRLADSSPALRTVLEHIHYADLTTVYPPVSQAVFAAAHRLTPPTASVEQRIGVLKIVLAAFDVATILLVLGLLRAAGRHPAWVIAYAWCPLVLKEFTNTAHLDTIAVCLTTAAVLLFVRATAARRAGASRMAGWWMTSSAIALALAVGAKLYPIILLPLLGVACARGFGWRHGLAWSAMVLVTCGLVLAPMFWPVLKAGTGDSSDAAASAEPAGRAGGDGLQAFLSRWEMNDFLFMLTVENLRPSAHLDPRDAAWFAFVPEAWRLSLTRHVGTVLGVEEMQAGFLLARGATLLVFAAIVLGLCWRTWRRPDNERLLEAVFLMVAWFWLLAPTQNPWYWAWALPFLPYARGRAWWAVSGLVMLYYLRFWLGYNFPDAELLGTRYPGKPFFDFVVTWIEFGPWFAWLFIAWLIRRDGNRRSRRRDLLLCPSSQTFSRPGRIL